MNIKEARAAIEAILEAIPDSALPAFDKVENRSGTTVVWWGGSGHHLGTARSNGERAPLVHRHRGSWAAIEAEMTYRADREYLANGDGLDQEQQ